MRIGGEITSVCKKKKTKKVICKNLVREKHDVVLRRCRIQTTLNGSFTVELHSNKSRVKKMIHDDFVVEHIQQ